MKQVDLETKSEDFIAIANKSDGTYRNIILNLRRWHAQGKGINKDDFTETLNGSWRDIYENAVKKHPAVKYIYDAIDLLQQVGFWLEDFIVEPTTLMIWGGNGFQKLFRKVQIQLALEYLTKETKILRQTKGEFSPSDGQIEAKGDKTDWSKYISELERLILNLEKQPVNYPSLLIAYLLFQLGFKCLISGNNEDAIRIWQKISTDKLENWLEKFFGSERLRIYPGAGLLLRHAYKQKDKLILLYFVNGLLLEILDYDAEAETVYRQIIAKQPDDASAHAKLGDILRKLKHYQEAEGAYRQAITSDPNFAYAYSRLGSLLRDLGRFRESEDAYQTAISKDPSDIFTYWRFGTLLTMMRRYTDAEAIYHEALVKGDNEIYISWIKSDLGNVLKRLGRYVDAKNVFNEIISKNPNLADLDVYLGIISVSKHLGEVISSDFLEKAHQFIRKDDWYNRACLESICDNYELALEYLKHAIPTPNHEFFCPLVWDDPDLEWIRSDPRFVEIVGPKPEEKNSEA